MTHSTPAGTIAQRRPAEQTALALVAILALVFSMMAMLAAQPVQAITTLGVLALSEDCEQTALHKQIDWSGNDTNVIGDMHSNAGITVSGARNDVSGEVTFDDTNCNFVMSGSDNTGGLTSPSNAASVADPAYAVPTAEQCTFTFAGAGDTDLASEASVWLDDDTLKPGLYCKTGSGKLQQSKQGVDGTVSFFAHGHIDLSNGSDADYTPFRADGVLTHSLANSVDAVTLAGSGTDADNNTFYRGIIYAPFGEAETGGQWITIGCIVAETVKLNGSNHTISGCDFAQPAPTITVDKTADPLSLPEPGGNFTFTVVVTNTSAEPVTIASLDDDIYGPLAGDADCQVGTVLAASGSCTFSFVGAFAGNAGDSQTDVVTVCADDADQNEACDDDDADVTITDVLPAITVDKTANPLSLPEPGGNFTFTVVVTNDSTVEAVTITELSDDIYGTLAGDADCQVGTVLAASGSCTFSFVGAFAGNAGDSQTDVVTARAVDDDANEATDTDDATVTITDVLPVINVDKTANPLSLPEPGGNFTFTVVVTNNSGEPVTITSLEDDIYGTLAGDADCQVGTVLASTGSCTFSFVGAFAGDTGDSQTDVVEVCADDDDENEACDDDDATVVISEGPVPSLVIDKVADATVITISGPANAQVANPSIVTWTLTYTLTNGPVTNAVITDVVPAGFTFLDAANGGTHAGGTVTWNLGTLTTSGSVSFRTTVNVATISRVAPTVNTAVIDSEETAPDEGQDSVTVTVQPPPLGGTPTPPPAPAVPNTAMGLEIGGQPVTMPIVLVVALLVGSLGAFALANVRSRRNRQV